MAPVSDEGKTMGELPDYLRDDAPPVAVCDTCGRKTWAEPESPTCEMPQPSGEACPGNWLMIDRG